MITLKLVSNKYLFQENDEIKWSSRWDYILKSMPNTNNHWFR